MAKHARLTADNNLTRLFLILVACGFIVAAVSTSRGEEELWKNCSTPKTHYVLQIPGSLVRSTDPEVTGCTYQTSDGEFTVEAVEQTDTAGPIQSLESRMQKEIDVLAGTVTDQKKAETGLPSPV